MTGHLRLAAILAGLLVACDQPCDEPEDTISVYDGASLCVESCSAGRETCGDSDDCLAGEYRCWLHCGAVFAADE